MVLEDRVTLAKEDPQLLNDLITEYQPFIQKVVYDTCKRFVEWGHDEELSIGLIAFEETIKRFETNKGSFLTLARIIIKNRVIDYLRKEQKHVYTDIDMDNLPEIPTNSSQENSLADEIAELQSFLIKYNILFQDLPDVSPVKRKLREELKMAAKELTMISHLMNQLIEKKQLPVQALAKHSNISYKKLERNRIYVITMALIWYLELPLLQGYIK